MRSCNRSWTVLLAACLVAACLGCQNGATQEDPTKSNGAGKKINPETQNNGSNGTNSAPKPASRPEVPKVILIGDRKLACRVWVGHTMPDATLPDIQGNQRPLAALYGEELTVVFFWNSESLYSMSELQDLTPDVAEPYRDKGLQVIGINVGDTPETAARQIQQVGAKFTNLLDQDRAFFLTNVATEKIPRTYLLDAKGKIVWFDDEYSPTTRRDLEQAIEAKFWEKENPNE